MVFHLLLLFLESPKKYQTLKGKWNTENFFYRHYHLPYLKKEKQKTIISQENNPKSVVHIRMHVEFYFVHLSTDIKYYNA